MKKFYICKHCGNIIEKINDAGVPVVCCGEPMTELAPNTTDGATEKHVPVATVSGSTVKVHVGSAEHPMLAAHYIQWIYLETKHGVQRKALTPGQKPAAIFTLHEDHPIAVYAYCNLHGLWKSEV